MESGKRKICLIGQFPPPVHGLSVALQTLYDGLKDDFDFEKTDITDNKKILGNLFKIAKSRADVFYLTIGQSRGGNLRDLAILRLIALKKKKCVVHLHGGYYRRLVEEEMSPRQKKSNFKAMSAVDAAIVLSPSLRPIFTGMVPPERIFVVPNCVQNSFLETEEGLREKIAARAKKEVLDVLYLSNFNPEKGYERVLALAKREKELCAGGAPRRFSFHFAGAFFSEEEEQKFFGIVRGDGLEDFIVFHGVVQGDEKAALLRQCDIFILLTRYPKEGQPVSILEAMGNGMAVVTTDQAAIADMVEDGANGVVCRAGEEEDAAMLYARMNALVPALARISLTNAAKVREHYSEEKYLAALREILQNV